MFTKTSIMFTSKISDSSIKKVVLTLLFTLIRAMYIFFHIQFQQVCHPHLLKLYLDKLTTLISHKRHDLAFSWQITGH